VRAGGERNVCRLVQAHGEESLRTACRLLPRRA
jgi:hypothetical protein